MRNGERMSPIPTKPTRPEPINQDDYRGYHKYFPGLEPYIGFGSITAGQISLLKKHGLKKSFGVLGQGNTDRQGYHQIFDKGYSDGKLCYEKYMLINLSVIDENFNQQSEQLDMKLSMHYPKWHDLELP